MHVVEQVAVERPVTDRIGGQVERHLAARLDLHAMLARGVIAMPRHQLKEVPVQVDRVAHHRVGDQGDPDALALSERDRHRHVRHVDAIERPHMAFYVADRDVKAQLLPELRMAIVPVGARLYATLLPLFGLALFAFQAPDESSAHGICPCSVA
jgi:hypothetical protein